MAKVTMVPVNSSNLAAIGYMEKEKDKKDSKGKIRVQFSRGAIYDYPATAEEYFEALKAESISTWFNKFKVGREFEKIS